MGPERTREELIPFINGNFLWIRCFDRQFITCCDLIETVDDEDDVLLAIADHISDLIDHVGGQQYYHTLLSTVELLAVVEDSAVRDAVIYFKIMYY